MLVDQAMEECKDEPAQARNESQARFRLQKNKLGNLAETREELKHVQMELDYAQSKLAHAEEEFKHKQAQRYYTRSNLTKESVDQLDE